MIRKSECWSRFGPPGSNGSRKMQLSFFLNLGIHIDRCVPKSLHEQPPTEREGRYKNKNNQIAAQLKEIHNTPITIKNSKFKKKDEFRCWDLWLHGPSLLFLPRIKWFFRVSSVYMSQGCWRTIPVGRRRRGRKLFSSHQGSSAARKLAITTPTKALKDGPVWGLGGSRDAFGPFLLLSFSGSSSLAGWEGDQFLPSAPCPAVSSFSSCLLAF